MVVVTLLKRGIIDSGHFFTVNDCFLFDGCRQETGYSTASAMV
jgi:hypothetical protein